ncbi:MAG: gliding motility-associated C-terminal domain-containing protein [Cyclobacteriaceae bacterium]
MATHIRASEIILRRTSNTTLEYEIEVIGYTDSGSDILFGGGKLTVGSTLYEGFEVTRIPIDAEKQIVFNSFKVVHTFSNPGWFTIGYREENRNEGVLNMFNSVETPFYVETNILIDPAFQLNNSPVLLVPPVDLGAIGSKFIHNPGAFDPDGDSLAYRLTIPRQSRDTTVFGYVPPNDPQFYTDFPRGNEAQSDEPKFTIDPITGDLEWDAPGQQGEYNVAFIVEEWRLIQGTWFLQGEVVRDMQIIIEESDNERPEITPPPDLCVEAGTLIEEIIEADDPDGHPVILEAFGGPFEFLTSPARFTPNPPVPQESPGFMTFTWQTNCSHVREAPYDVILKATDEPFRNEGPPLAEFASWSIQVVAPRPTGLTTTLQPGSAISLNWDPYECSNANRIQIWRRVDMFDIALDSCLTGMPGGAGYELIDVVDIRQTDYLDDNQGFGLAAGANYCYRIVAEFAQPGGGESFVSDEACTIMLADAPIPTNVSVLNTSETEGEMLVRWMEPFEIDQALFPPPYTYEVFRSEGLSGTVNRTSLGITADTVLIDTLLNTVENPYNYQVELIDATGQKVDTSAVASSVWLEPTPLVQSIELTWQAEVPWSNNVQDFPQHFIFRNNTNPNNPAEFAQIAVQNVNLFGFRYLDDGTHNGQPLDDETTYCYFITTQGSYGNPLIDEPLQNNSQVVCSQPNDEIAPCTPVGFRLDENFDCESFLADQVCQFSNFSNRLVWEEDLSPECDDDVRSFNIYFSADGTEESFELVATVTESEFTHTGIPSFKGCYRVSAVDRSGNESELSETVCNDNCPFFQLPNVFTPNNDGFNDTFFPFAESDGSNPEDRSLCPRFVKTVFLQVFDRSGNRVFEYDSTEDAERSIFIEWPGKTSSGSELPAGVYYYVADVTFDVLDESKAEQQTTGWVHIMK